ncbi:response regulator transcription factor [Nocardia otitidiscaviarum]|uniref:Response regulator transcription factor n=1 Tax=Nocardia otitidiscaviarum TaxID=1823 RepID=A0A379JHM9_9NOCA|nr:MULTISPECIES: response regulator transcription factor [Nocardia]MBF6134701.1 response regulator transcription factor [Nocardia otitidiscaviarum]MBF6177218.1 response regulator transcription factor [Nocardia otitidiscaviarum]MBF6236390.1 response regulator transcription factor [Nocardia otitidiscaviarum]MBF6485673.1 response regulator transcription factor [Nocardia otitidiscaviarum]MCP9618953.1 response regulator transcription factor [Nocardia otitidiscaviarum]
MGANLLIVEDDDRVREALRLAMEDEGYEVSEAGGAEVALAQVRSRGVPDVMIVDLMLGAMDGFTCIREVRRDHDVPIIVVSARDDTHDVVAALEAGADDFVTKPFEIKEITARMRALRRRARLAQGRDAAPDPDGRPEVVLDAESNPPLVLSQDSGRLLRGDEEVHLTLTEYRLLCELAEAPGRVLSRDVLLERVWDRGFFGDQRIVDVHMRRLRTKIERDPSAPRIVVTVRGLGYRLDVQR